MEPWWDELQPPGIPRTCLWCGVTVYLQPEEPYVLHVYCPACRELARQPNQTGGDHDDE